MILSTGHKQVLSPLQICDSSARNARVCGPGLLHKCPSALTDKNNYVFVFSLVAVLYSINLKRGSLLMSESPPAKW